MVHELMHAHSHFYDYEKFILRAEDEYEDDEHFPNAEEEHAVTLSNKVSKKLGENIQLKYIGAKSYKDKPLV